jgi:hypothetical protein
VAIMTERGWANSDASALVQQAHNVREVAKRRASRDEAPGHLIRGAIIGGIGAVVTLVTLGAAMSSEGGGTYIVAWGALAVGFFELAYGLWLYFEGRAN